MKTISLEAYDNLMQAYAEQEERFDRKLSRLNKRLNRTIGWLISLLSMSMAGNVAQFYVYATILVQLQ